MKIKKMVSLALIPMSVGTVLAIGSNTQSVSAKSHTIPASMRGNWYAYNGRIYYHMKFGKYGEYVGRTLHKQKQTASKYKISGKNYYEIFTSVNPYYARVSSGKYAGKNRKTLTTMSQGMETVYFRNKIKHSYTHQAPNGRAKKVSSKKYTWHNALPSNIRGFWIKGSSNVMISKNKVDYGRTGWPETTLTNAKYRSAGKNTYVLKGTYHNANLTKKNSQMKFKRVGKKLQFKFSTSAKYSYLAGFHRK